MHRRAFPVGVKRPELGPDYTPTRFAGENRKYTVEQLLRGFQRSFTEMFGHRMVTASHGDAKISCACML
jgi:hypothetical protein